MSTVYRYNKTRSGVSTVATVSAMGNSPPSARPTIVVSPSANAIPKYVMSASGSCGNRLDTTCGAQARSRGAAANCARLLRFDGIGSSSNEYPQRTQNDSDGTSCPHCGQVIASGTGSVSVMFVGVGSARALRACEAVDDGSREQAC